MELNMFYLAISATLLLSAHSGKQFMPTQHDHLSTTEAFKDHTEHTTTFSIENGNDVTFFSATDQPPNGNLGNPGGGNCSVSILHPIDIVNSQNNCGIDPVVNDTDANVDDEFEQIYPNISVVRCDHNLKCIDGKATDCYCDKLCFIYNDCCISEVRRMLPTAYGMESSNRIFTHLAKFVTGVKEANVEEVEMKRKSRCIEDKNGKQGYWMINKCLNVSFTQTEEIRMKCNNSSDKYGWDNIPVSYEDKSGRTLTYKNTYCALCNGAKKSDLSFWNVEAKCPSNVSIDGSILLQTLDTLCEIKVNIPASITNLRACSKSKFNETICKHNTELIHSDETLLLQQQQQLCDTYIYPITNEVTVYRNPHCAYCRENQYDFTNYDCSVDLSDIPENGDQNGFGPSGPPVNFRVLFDFSNDLSIVAKPICDGWKQCDLNEEFDCNSKQCWQLTCPPGYNMVTKQCVRVAGYIPRLVTYKPVETLNSNVTDEHHTVTVLYTSVSFSDIGNVTIYEDLFATFKIILGNLLAMYSPSTTVMYINQTDGDGIWEHNIIHFRLKVVDFTWKNITEMFKDIPNEMNVSISNYKRNEILLCLKGTLVESHESIFSNGTLEWMTLPGLNYSVRTRNTRWLVSFDKSGVKFNHVATCIETAYPLYRDCTMVSFQLTEVKIVNESLIVSNSSLSFPFGHYVLAEDRVFVCSIDVILRGSYVNMFEYSSHFNIASIISSSISILMLVLVILLHFILRQLKSTHGKNLTTVSVYTLTVHIMLMSQYIFETEYCVLFAVVLQFVLLQMFTWMSIIAVDMAILFKSNVQTDASKSCSLFLKYFVISITLSSAVIVPSLVLHFTESNFNPGYGLNGVCWITNTKALICLFCIPIGASLLLNYFLFITIVCIIQKRRFSSHGKHSKNATYFLVYLKLTFILGMSWIVGFIGAFAHNEVIWIIHIILNGLQGLSIFICFVTNARVTTYFRRLTTKTFSSSSTTKSSLPVSQETSLNYND